MSTQQPLTPDETLAEAVKLYAHRKRFPPGSHRKQYVFLAAHRLAQWIDATPEASDAVNAAEREHTREGRAAAKAAADRLRAALAEPRHLRRAALRSACIAVGHTPDDDQSIGSLEALTQAAIAAYDHDVDHLQANYRHVVRTARTVAPFADLEARVPISKGITLYRDSRNRRASEEQS